MKDYLINEMVKIIGEEDRGIIFSLTTEEESKIKELIDIDSYNNVAELRNLRNYLVMTLYSSIKEDNSNFRAYNTYLTIITSMIDKKIFNLGGEV